MDQLSAMATFVRAVETGSLSAAARSLPSSLTSVSRQISALEQHFGTRLLLRTTRQLALTDDGRILMSARNRSSARSRKSKRRCHATATSPRDGFA